MLLDSIDTKINESKQAPSGGLFRARVSSPHIVAIFRIQTDFLPAKQADETPLKRLRAEVIKLPHLHWRLLMYISF